MLPQLIQTIQRFSKQTIDKGRATVVLLKKE
jgi:hypothetical protein